MNIFLIFSAIVMGVVEDTVQSARFSIIFLISRIIIACEVVGTVCSTRLSNIFRIILIFYLQSVLTSGFCGSSSLRGIRGVLFFRYCRTFMWSVCGNCVR